MTASQIVDVLRLAEYAGRDAAIKAVPEPMYVVERANPFDDESPITKRYEPAMGGVCGFAWVNIPGVGMLARVAKARYETSIHDVSIHRGYPKGLDIWVSSYGQSMTRKDAYARAFAAVLRANGFDQAYAQSRMD